MNAIDLDEESIELDGGWMTRHQLTDAIKAKLNAGQYDVAKHGAALELLAKTLSELRPLTVRVTVEMAEALTQAAARSGETEPSIVRQALAAYLTRGEKASFTSQPGVPVRSAKSVASAVRPQ